MVPSVPDTGASYSPAALLSGCSGLLRQRVGGHAPEASGMRIQIPIMWHKLNKGPPRPGQRAGPRDMTVNKSIFAPQEWTVGGWGTRAKKSTGKTMHATKHTTGFLQDAVGTQRQIMEEYLEEDTFPHTMNGIKNASGRERAKEWLQQEGP